MTFTECVQICADDQELIKEFNRLFDARLGVDNRPAIIKMVDEAAGYNPFTNDYIKFIQFVYQVIWLPLLDEQDKESNPVL
jgi:hypothetical protein